MKICESNYIIIYMISHDNLDRFHLFMTGKQVVSLTWIRKAASNVLRVACNNHGNAPYLGSRNFWNARFQEKVIM